MKRYSRLLALFVLVAAALTLGGPSAHGQRLGRAASELATVAANDSLYYDLTFAVGRPAIVSIAGDASTPLELYMYDSDGNVAVGTGLGDRKTARMNVYRGGSFRIEVRNPGPTTNNFVISVAN